jgi:hypothetical protein
MDMVGRGDSLQNAMDVGRSRDDTREGKSFSTSGKEESFMG